MAISFSSSVEEVAKDCYYWKQGRRYEKNKSYIAASFCFEIVNANSTALSGVVWSNRKK